MVFGNYYLSGPASMVADSASTLGFGATEGISTDSTVGNIRTKNLSIHPKTNHVFYGEGFTEKDTRHCVNTTSLICIRASLLQFNLAHNHLN